jgi:curved DNA-binding protein CbpA
LGAKALDPYRVLFVDSLAPESVIRAAYRALARVYHPDHNLDPDASERMAELNRAFAMVGNSSARAAYDRLHQRGRAATDTPPDAPVPPPAVVVSPRSTGSRWRPATEVAPEAAAVMDFGRYEGWRLADIARADRDYLRWLYRSSGGGRFRGAIDRLMAASPA